MDASVTELLHQAGQGDAQAAARVYTLLYEDLQRLARLRLSRQVRPGSADTGALVHECWLRLQSLAGARFEDRGHFLAYAARAMRSIVTDMARRHAAQRRGGDLEQVTLDTAAADAVATDPPEDLLALDEALQALQQLDERAAQVVEMRFFAGLDEDEIAQALQVSLRTVQRDWRRARAYLALALQR